ncbi:cytochrome P450 [Ilumatobacter coccineus]|uniref:Cytochrome P450 n=1 Tax=Ilumatobacter coccineus (strain NBRC 103263 / KCTC 29153 / YM16-304) TaxID=1313172 RepID=A0A6C7E5R1_ILUCY|nr:cytochrome P450 [Ilumatobacter coccineus]BAN01881.1 cytochrome P450 [Ilumatobacter coccineus YM16-304]
MSDRLIVDLLDPNFYQRNPHDAWSWMRDNEPVYRDERNGLWGVTKHADLMDVERRSSVFVSGQGYRAVWSPSEINMIAQDDPRHRQQRMLVQGNFTKKSVEQRQADLETLTTEIIDAALADGATEMEVVDAVAGQLPARVTAQLLGYPDDRWRDLKSWSERLMRTDMRERDGLVFREFEAANHEFVGALSEIAKAKMAEPGDDLISTWLHSTIDGEPLPPAAIAHEVGLFISGGAETTRTAISHGLRTFVDHPDQWDAMGADPDLVPGAVEEVLRWVTPLNNMFRRAAADDVIGDQPVERGDRIVLLYPAANRDADVFDDPDTFDIRRSPNKHVAFGFGTHLCIGTHVARGSLSAVFGQLSRRITDLSVVTEPEVEANIFARAVASFRLGFAQR